MTYSDIKTELGNEILLLLKKDKWRVKSQYPIFAFDKGIDYDEYTLQKEKLILTFTWDNWFEWEISGDDESIAIVEPLLDSLSKK